MWTVDHDRALRAEVERRFRSRTPAKSVIDWRPEDRVVRSEIRSWCLDEYGELPPFEDYDWGIRFAAWYHRMALRVLRELEPESLQAYRLAYRNRLR